jgi:ribose-phosphate pyrophosphokinase
MRPVVFGVGIEPEFIGGLHRQLDSDLGTLCMRAFPDAESYIRVDTDCAGRDVIIAANLCAPDHKTLPVLLLAETLRDLGSATVGLVAPYLPYMRQDARFAPGEGITARYFARILSSHVDWLTTVDPHLHRIHTLDEVYAVPSRVAHAASAIAGWIGEHVQQPLLVGPDAESEQWVADVADRIGAPYLTLKKTRRGDRDVRVSVPDVERYPGYTPVLVDDMVSTGHTLRAAVMHLVAAGMPAPVCAVVHALFAAGAMDAIMSAGAARVVSCNTVVHASNGIDVWDALTEAARAFLPAQHAAGLVAREAKP